MDFTNPYAAPIPPHCLRGWIIAVIGDPLCNQPQGWAPKGGTPRFVGPSRRAVTRLSRKAVGYDST
jgi:hypothetical protein